MQLLRLLEGAFYLAALCFRLVQVVDQLSVLQNVTLRVCQSHQQLLFKVCQLYLKLVFLLEQLCLARLKFWLLEVDRQRKQLTFKTTLGDSKVDGRDKCLVVGRNLDKLVTRCQI